jgi:hypothetical protein
VAPCSAVQINRHFGVIYCLHLHCRTTQESNQRCERSNQTTPADCLLSLLFQPEDGGSTFLRNFGELMPDYTLIRQFISLHYFLIYY